MHLFLIRHGESYVNLGNWDSLESMDTGLTEKGYQQAEALGAWLKESDMEADALYCSTMRRTLETAKYVSEAFNIPAVPDDRLREIGNSYKSGKAIEETKLPRRYNSNYAHVAPFLSRADEPDDVESWLHFRARLGDFIHGLMDQYYDKRVYIVAHGGVISAIFDNMYNVGPYRRCDVHNYNTSWTQFEYRTGERLSPWYLWFHNRIDHLIAAGLM